MNKLGRGNWILMSFFIIISLIVFVSATVSWNSGMDVNINLGNSTENENTPYTYNLSSNVTFDLGDEPLRYIFGENSNISTSIYGAKPFSFFSEWILINSTTGIFSINATDDNRTGEFNITFDVYNSGSTQSAGARTFNFIINATNDEPLFLNVEENQEFNWSDSLSSNYTILAIDEEGHYPLNFTLDVINCTHGAQTGRNDNENCSVFELTNISNNSASLNLSYSNELVGTYWFKLNITESGHVCPHNHCEENYTDILVESLDVKLSVLSSLSIDISNCTNQELTQGEWLNCSINITTIGEDDFVNVSTSAGLTQGRTYDGANNYWDSEWFYENSSQQTAANNLIEIPISILLNKSNVGNWTINFTADDGYNPLTSQIDLFVNWTESNVTINKTYDGEHLTIYENQTIYINATDNDLYIPDKGLKKENLTFRSNVSWITITAPSSQLLLEYNNRNYIEASLLIDFESGNATCGANTNCSVLVNVTDVSGNTDNLTMIFEFSGDTAPEWNLSKSYVNASFEGDNVYINLSEGYVSDVDLDPITFYYSNTSRFDAFNLTSEGIINFTSSDIDVGYHNITLIAGDGKLNSSISFNFTIYNLDDLPSILDFYNSSSDSIENATTYFSYEGKTEEFTLIISDNDFLIPEGQKTFYNETLTINTTCVNSSGGVVDLFDFEFQRYFPAAKDAFYNDSLYISQDIVGNYTVTINITDLSGNSISRVFYFNITSVNDAPVLREITTQTITIMDSFFLNISEYASDAENDTLTYDMLNLSEGGLDFLDVNSTTGVVYNPNSLDNYSGTWTYNVTVSDIHGSVGYTNFTLIIYGYPNITSPLEDYVFNLTEGNSTGNLYFNVSYGVNNSNLTYKIYMDRIVYSNSTDFNYTELISNSSLRNETNFILTRENNFTWNFTPSYTDESYGMLKNLTLVVYNPIYPTLNDSINWKVNITHTNQNITFKSGAYISDKGPISAGSLVSVNLSQYFEDADYFDKTILQNVNFTIETVSSGTRYIESASSFNDWILTITSPVATTEIMKVHAYEWNSSNVTINNATSNEFQVEVIEASTVEVPTSSSGGGSTKLKHYSLKLVVPQDIIISDNNFIEIPFSVQNNGQIDLRGINLSSFVRFNDEFSEDVKISLGESYLPELKFGQSENFTMRIIANTQRPGKYKATILANVTSPKFSDWGDFFIELKKTNESEAEQILIFTEKMVADNPECLELKELINQAKVAFELGEYSNSLRLAEEATTACEEAISANEQIRYPVSGFVKDNFYYISFTTLVIFIVGFIFYIYKRVRFNKSKMNDYI